MFDITSNYHNFETLPNGRFTEFDKKLCCTHTWDDVPIERRVLVDDDDQDVVHQVCVNCAAECLRSTTDLEILEYDNSKSVDFGRAW